MEALEHEAVPQHEVMTEEETEELLQKFEIDKSQIPRIKENDAALKSLEAVPGDVIEITRDSPTAGEAKYYRVVVE